jgi:hypothetical protein
VVELLLLSLLSFTTAILVVGDGFAFFSTSLFNVGLLSLSMLSPLLSAAFCQRPFLLSVSSWSSLVQSLFGCFQQQDRSHIVASRRCPGTSSLLSRQWRA